jgi:hypothetical protein
MKTLFLETKSRALTRSAAPAVLAMIERIPTSWAIRPWKRLPKGKRPIKHVVKRPITLPLSSLEDSIWSMLSALVEVITITNPLKKRKRDISRKLLAAATEIMETGNRKEPVHHQLSLLPLCPQNATKTAAIRAPRPFAAHINPYSPGPSPSRSLPRDGSRIE